MSAFWRWNRKLHRWASYLLLVPLAFWFASGLFMTWSDLHVVRGEHNMRVQEQALLDGASMGRFLPKGQAVHGATAVRIGDRIALLLETPIGRDLIDVQTGEVLSPLSQKNAIAAAQADFAPEATVLTADYLEGDAPFDYRGPMPVWRVAFGDAEGTVIYLDPTTARVRARRTDHWRWFDFFWMLHILDFETRDNINNPLVMAASLVAMLFMVTGIVLIIQHVKPGRRGRAGF